MINLPNEYLNNMKSLLKDEYDNYLASFNNPSYHGLRINTSKISVEEFLRISPFKLEPIPWTSDGFYYQEEDKPSKHPYYYAGLYYLQEPSAMLPAEALPINNNDIVLDACAAPGGKSTKLLNKLNNTGLLISNDISVSRAQVLLKTIENEGFKNYYVMAQDIINLNKFENCFDAILLDAPCSGEGMFRKDPSLINSWKQRNAEYYAPIQKQLIIKCLSMLKKGGKLLYSTCTFNPQEDEEVIEYALSIYPNLKVLPIKRYEGFVSGVTTNTKNAIRLYPHKIKGEGHFVCELQLGDDDYTKQISNTNVNKPDDKFFNHLNINFNNGKFVNRNNKLYFIPNINFDTNSLRILRSGLLLGEYKHDKFEPAHALSLALKTNEYDKVINFTLEDPRLIKYLKCETLEVKDFNLDGYVLVCVNNYPLGWGKVNNHTLKNKYPINYKYI